MTSSATIQLQVGNAIPPGNEKETHEIIEFWHGANAFFRNLSFTAQGKIGGAADAYRISLDAGELIAAMNNARDQSGSFSRHRLAYVDDPATAIAAGLSVSVSAEDHSITEEESYQVATIFIQQMVIAVNLIRPGAIQLLESRFAGEGAHKYKPQNYDSSLYYGALKVSQENQWPPLKTLALEKVWAWLEETESSQTDTAIKSINEVLFTMLKVAENRHEYSARTALMVMYQLEIMLDCRQVNSLADVYNRTALILEDSPHHYEWLSELQGARNSLFMASVPVHRPPLICHTTEHALRQQSGQHPSAVESGTGLVLALLQDLVEHGAQRYRFSETMLRE